MLVIKLTLCCVLALVLVDPAHQVSGYDRIVHILWVCV